VVFSTYLGGSADDAGNGISTAGAGRIVVIGTTTSADFPFTAPAPPGTTGQGSTAFLVTYTRP
jgi:hypothetical protein